MRNDKEYQLCKAIATYLKYQYPKIIYHFDYAGLGLSKAQAGKMKAIQGERGFCDLQICKSRSEIKQIQMCRSYSLKYCGLFIEIKADGENIFKKDGITPKSEHIAEQLKMIDRLNKEGYYAILCIGFDEVKKVLDWYLNE